MPNTTLVSWRNALFGLFVVNGVVGATWAARLPAVREDTGASLQVMGLALLGAAIGAIAGLSIGPLLMHRIGARRTLAITLYVMMAGMLLAAVGSTIAGQIWFVAIGTTIWGLFIGSADVVTNIEAAANEREIGKTLMPLMHAFFSIGTVLGALAGTLGAAAGWTVLANLAVVVAVSAVIIAWAVRHIPERAELAAEAEHLPLRERIKVNARAWRDPIAILIGIGVLANGFAEGGAGDWLAIGAVDGHGLTEAMGAFLFGVFVTGMTVVRLIGGPIVDRWGRVWALRVSAVCALAGICLFIWSDVFAAIAIGALLWGGGVALAFPLGMSAAADAPNGPERVSVVSTLGYGSFLIGPPVLGFLGHEWGILPALSVLLVLLAVAMLVAPAARERAELPVAAT